MKIKPTRKHGVVVELGPNETQLPTIERPLLFRIKRVLVPVDFSDCSRKALQYAVPFAKQFGAEIVLLYVVQPYVPVPEMGAVDTDLLLSRMRESGEGELAKLRASITDDVKVKVELRVGCPDFEIVKAADEVDADIILLSTHGRTGLGRVFVGSVAEHVTRYAHCPVFVVREREHEFVDVHPSATNTKRGEEVWPPAQHRSSIQPSTGTMKRKLLVALAALILLVGFTGTFAQSKRERAAKEFMRDKLELSQQMLEGVALENYDLIILKGSRLSAMTKEGDWRVFENPNYDSQSLAFRKQVDALVNAAKDKNLDAATLAYVRMTMSCVDCHKAVRGKLVAAVH